MLCSLCNKPIDVKQILFTIFCRKVGDYGESWKKDGRANQSDSIKDDRPTLNYHPDCFQELAGDDFIEDLVTVKKEAIKKKSKAPVERWFS